VNSFPSTDPPRVLSEIKVSTPDELTRLKSRSLLVSLEADSAGNVEDHQAGVVVCLVCQIQQPTASKIVEGRAVRHGETPQLQSFLNNKMEEIKCVGIDKWVTLAVTNQCSTGV